MVIEIDSSGNESSQIVIFMTIPLLSIASLWHNLETSNEGTQQSVHAVEIPHCGLTHSIPFSACNGHHILNVIQQEIYLAEMELGSTLTGKTEGRARAFSRV
jgi:hypothetical protein